MNPGFHCTRQMADSLYDVVCERFADVNVVNRVPHGGGGVMVWTGTDNKHNGTLNAQRYRDEILRPVVVPFIHCHHLMFQHDNAQPHFADLYTIPVS